eukprot:scaffold42458_cov68-Phaeocystis_antarctica.AAC.3
MRASSGVDATLAVLGVHSISTERTTVHTTVHRLIPTSDIKPYVNAKMQFMKLRRVVEAITKD